MSTQQKIIAVYKVVHRPTGLYYIGSTSNAGQRWKTHRSALRRCCHWNVRFNTLVTEGSTVDDFDFFVVEALEDIATARCREVEILVAAGADSSCVNILLSSGGGDAHTRHPNREAILAKRVASQKAITARMSAEERKLRWSKPGELNGMYGKTHTPETKRFFSELHTGNTYVLGKKRSPEVCKQISERAKKRTGAANSFFGKKHSEDTRKAMSERMRGKKPTNTRQILADGKLYPSVTEAARQLGVTPGLIVYRLKSAKYDYEYCD